VLERTDASPQIVKVSASQFTGRDYKPLVRLFELENIRIRTYHPESNGVLERARRTMRETLAEDKLETLGRARELLGYWVAHFNSGQLHAALHNLPPVEYYRGNPKARFIKRREKLEEARKRRAHIGGGRLQAAAHVTGEKWLVRSAEKLDGR